MATTTPSPYMSLPVPTVSEDPGPDWGSNTNACWSIVDAHTHIAGSGQQITPAGMDINVDLDFGGNNATSIKSVRFTSQSAVLSGGSDLGCLYEVLNDLYFNDGVGNQIRITQSGSVTGATGTITGLPSGTASASYAAAAFTFQSATNTPASMNVGPLIVGNVVANSKTVTISPNNAIAANYAFTLPAALPASTNYTTLDSSGNLSFNSSGSSGSGAVILATSATLATPTINSASLATPTITGVLTVSTSGIAFLSGTMTNYQEGTWTPTMANVSNTTARTPQVGRFQQIGNYVYCVVTVSITTSSASTAAYTMTLPVAPTNNFSDVNQAMGVCAAAGSNTLFSGRGSAVTSAKTINFSIAATSAAIVSQTFTHSFTYILNT